MLPSLSSVTSHLKLNWVVSTGIKNNKVHDGTVHWAGTIGSPWKCWTLQSDHLTLAGAFTKVKEELGQLDIVCNNAGILDESQWRKCVDVNLVSLKFSTCLLCFLDRYVPYMLNFVFIFLQKAVIHGTLLAIEHMAVHKGGNGGVVINTASITGFQRIISFIYLHCSIAAIRSSTCFLFPAAAVAPVVAVRDMKGYIYTDKYLTVSQHQWRLDIDCGLDTAEMKRAAFYINTRSWSHRLPCDALPDQNLM